MIFSVRLTVFIVRYS